jgi:hypothetical protein
VDPANARNADPIHLVVKLHARRTSDDVIVWLDHSDPRCSRSPGSVQNADSSVVQYFNDASGSIQTLLGSLAGTFHGSEVVSTYISSGAATLCAAMYDDTTHVRVGAAARAPFVVRGA